MTAPMLMTDCPTEETLAAYIDDRLDAATRRKVTEHLASCGECRELVMMTTDFQATETPANVVRGPFGWIATAAALAAAAVLVLLVLPDTGRWYSSVQRTARPTIDYWARIFGMRPVVRAQDMADVIEAAQGLSNRPALGRLAGDFPYREEAKRYRSGDTGSLDMGKAALYVLAAEIEESKSPDLHRRGVTKFLIAERGSEFQEAILDLETAYEKARDDERDAVAIDLSAALIAVGGWSGDKKAYERALALSDEVWTRTHSLDAAWNRAAALQLLGQDKAAIQAWDGYVTLDPNSAWAKEAKRRRDDLNANP